MITKETEAKKDIVTTGGAKLYLMNSKAHLSSKTEDPQLTQPSIKILDKHPESVGKAEGQSQAMSAKELKATEHPKPIRSAETEGPPRSCKVFSVRHEPLSIINSLPE